ncbi:MAG: ABC transporter ATP-binding protein [Candidatus Competibacteraceae bacterium]
MNPVLETRDLAIGYRVPTQRRVAENIAVQLWPGELVCLLGPNGAGKSTLLRTLARMQRPLAGQVRLLGEDMAHLKPRDLARRLSVVLTERVEVSRLTVAALVALGRYPHTEWSGRLSAADEKIVHWALRTVGILELAHRAVTELSDGERQKAMLARALAQEPTVLILDEPTAFLDLPRRVVIMNTLRRLAREGDYAILLSTHDLELALRCADRIWLLPLQGALQIGAPEDLVLNGALQSAFQSEGVEFDPYTGSFKLSQPTVGRVALSGEGLPRRWTERALERAGFCIDEQTGGLRITIAVDPAGLLWRIEGDARIEYRSLLELVGHLSAGKIK